MKKYIHIPFKPKMPKISYKHNTGKQQLPPERLELQDLFKTGKVNVQKLAFCVNVCYNLADLMETLIFEAEAELKKAGPNLGFEIRHSIERMKIQTREMVRFVDLKTSEKFAESYGETSDRLKELIIDFYKNTIVQ